MGKGFSSDYGFGEYHSMNTVMPLLIRILKPDKVEYTPPKSQADKAEGVDCYAYFGDNKEKWAIKCRKKEKAYGDITLETQNGDGSPADWDKIKQGHIDKSYYVLFSFPLHLFSPIGFLSLFLDLDLFPIISL